MYFATFPISSFTDVFHVALRSALAGQNQNFFHTAVGNDFHFLFDLLHRELHSVDVVIAVKAAVHTVVLAIVCYVKGREQTDGIL
jgi:hypothetical protein